MIAGRSPVLRPGVRAASPLALLVATHLFFAGHNRPGGGFAAGLVVGAVIALRALAGLPRPTAAVPLLATGGLVVGLEALASIVGNGVLLDQVMWKAQLPLLGTVKAGSSLVFDAGVVLVVVGLVVALVEGLGAAELAGDRVDADRGGRG